jgi:hypothetical protein
MRQIICDKGSVARFATKGDFFFVAVATKDIYIDLLSQILCRKSVATALSATKGRKDPFGRSLGHDAVRR